MIEARGRSPDSSARRRRVAILAGLLLAVSPLAWSSASWAIGSREPTMVSNPADFRAFYCAAQTLVRGRDPYLTEPLRACEHAAAALYGLRMLDGLVLPAPLPAFALALFAPLALLRFNVASPLWLALSLVAFAVSAILLTRLTRFPLVGSLLVLGGAVAYVCVPLGQVVPFVVAALCGAALALREKRYALAAIFCGLSALEPHIALPACLAVFFWCARARVRLACVGAGAVGLSLVFAGFPMCREYFSTVLPLHALSQVDDLTSQYSLTTLVSAFGADSREALFLGTLSYIAMTAAGIAVARRLAVRFRDEAYLVLVPPAFAVLGGTFVHLAQIGVAIPAIVLLLCRAYRNGLGRNVAFGAMLALAIPWGSIAEAPAFVGFFASHATPPRTVSPLPAGSHTFAETTEMAFRRGGGYGSNGAPLAWELALRTPTWLGLIAFVTLAMGAALPARKAPTALVA